MRWVQYGKYGWVRINGLEGIPSAYVHTREWEGRRLITRVLLNDQPWENIDSAKIKAFPIGWVESMVNTPEALAELAKSDDADPRKDELSVALHRFDKQFILGDPPYAKDDETPKLARPDGSDPDRFYRQVAARYLAVLAESRSIAPALAEEAGVPIPTVHRWINEARRRGFLPPARKGRAG